MQVEKQRAYAKINLTLDVVGKRADGYHEMEMVMQLISLYDEITFTENESGEISLSISGANLSAGEDNLVMRAARLFYNQLGKPCRGVHLALEKRIPMQAGMAGGSSDAAAVLKGLNEMEYRPFESKTLFQMAEKLGSDVPYCLLGKTALATGRGEILKEIAPMPHCFVAVCKPSFGISTPNLFQEIDQKVILTRPKTQDMVAAIKRGKVGEIGALLSNVFEQALSPAQRDEVFAIEHEMRRHGCAGTAMTGSGPTVFALFQQQAAAQGAVSSLREKYQETFLCETV